MALRLTLVSETAPGIQIRHLEQLNLAADFENRGKKPVSVVIDATPLSHGSYALEITDAQGKPVKARAFGMCGTMSPLQESEIALIEAGTTFRTPVQSGRLTLAPGGYRARVRYEAHRSDHAKDSLAPEVVKRLRHLWTGTLHSNWISLALQP